MKKSKRLITLVVVLTVISVSTFALTRYEKKQEEIQNSDAVILEISEESVEAISWEFSNESFAFHKEEGGWIYDDDEAFPVNDETVTDILSNFEVFGVNFIIENVEDYGQYGLDAPEGVISITTSEQIYELKLGDFSQMDEQRYVDIGDGNVYLVSEDPADYLQTELSDMILHDETAEFENVVDVGFAGDEAYTISYMEESSCSYTENDTYFTEQNGEIVPVDPEKVTTYLDTIESLSLVNYVTYNATDEELANYGLDNPELAVTVNYTYTDEDENELADSYVLYIGQNQEELEEAEQAEINEEDDIPEVTKYVRIGDSKIVYILDDSSYETLAAASYNELRHDEVFWADSDTMTQINISLEGEEHVLTSKIDEEDEETRVWYYGDEKVELTDFRSELKTLLADSFTDEAPGEKEEISLTIHLDNENFTQVKIQLYRYDGTNCLAVVDGESIALVERSSVVELIEAVQEIVLN